MKRFVQLIPEIIAALLIILFVYAAISKLLEWATFREALSRHPIPEWASWFISWMLPCVELCVSGLLLIPSLRKAGLYCSLLLMGVMTIYLGLVLSGRLGRVPCSCGGILSLLDWHAHLIFNTVVVALIIVGLITSNTEKIFTQRNHKWNGSFPGDRRFR